MIKQTFTYTDYNDNEKTEDLYFHISRADLLDHLSLKDDLEGLMQRLEANSTSDVSTDDIRTIVGLVKRFVKMGYGVRSADGEKFSKNEKNWEDFTSSAAHDEFIYSLFENPEKAVEFLVSLVPKTLREAVDKEIAERNSLETVPDDAFKFESVEELEAKIAAIRAARPE